MSTVPRQYFLYAEDDPDDQVQFSEIVAKISPDYEVVICNQGLELIKFLETLQPGDYLPCCVILDINMPIWDGVRTLKEIKTHPVFQSLAVVMFTTSDSHREMNLCKQMGADEFLVKPVTYDQFEERIKTFASYCRTLQQR